MKKIGIFYGSTTGNTESAAEKIGQSIGNADVRNIGSTAPDALNAYDVLLLGSSTWGLGELQDDWDAVVDKLTKLNLEGKHVSFFGTGDQMTYSDTFVDAMGILKEKLEKTGANFVGAWSADGYEHSGSKAEEDGFFCGLALDEDNQPEMSDARIDAWVEQLKQQL